MKNEPVPRICNRYFYPAELDIPKDHFGFVDLARAGGALLTAERLLERRVCLIIGPPWIGKTFVAKMISEGSTRLAEFPALPPAQAPKANVHLTSLDQESSAEQIPPLGWDEWKQSDAQFLWIVDSLDEAEECRKGVLQDVLNVLKNLAPDERDRLTLLLFAREVEVPLPFRDELKTLYPTSPHQPQGFACLRLAPMDRQEARNYLGSNDALDRVSSLIERCSLSGLAPYPVVLDYLRDLPPDADVDERTVWREVLRILLRESPPKGRPRHVKTEPEEQLKAAERIAASIQFTEHKEVRYGLYPTLEDLFPNEPNPRDRDAGRDVLNSVLFNSTSTGYRFSHKNIRECLCAYCLGDLELTALRPLLSGADGLFETHFGVLRELYGTTQRHDVKAWIAETILNKLMDLAKESRYPLWVDDKELHRIAASALGDKVGALLADSRKNINERVLLLQIAEANRLTETVPVALTIARNGRLPYLLRSEAVMLVLSLGTTGDLRKLEGIAKSRSKGREASALAAKVISGLVERKVWNKRKAVRYAPDERSDSLSPITEALYSLKRDLTDEDRRGIIIDTLQYRNAEKLTRHRAELFVDCMNEVLQNDDLEQEDKDLIVPIADFVHDTAIQSDIRFRESRDARRVLYEAKVRQDVAEGKTKANSVSRWWRFDLRYEDVDWLLKLAKELGSKATYVWEDLYRLVYWGNLQDTNLTSKRREIRRVMRELAPALLARCDLLHRKQKAYQKRREKKEEAKTKAEDRYTIPQVVETQLKKEMSPQQQLWKLGWVCFSKDAARPRNVDGKWSELGEETRQAVFGVCRKALEKVEPTKIPDGPFSALVLYEAAVFRAVVQQQSPGWLNAALVRNWLPAVLRSYSSDDIPTSIVRACAIADADATEDVLLYAIKSDARQHPKFVAAWDYVPHDLWTASLSAKVARMIEAGELSLEAQVELLDLVAARAPEQALPIARRWSRKEGEGADHRLLRWKGLDVLLALAPGEAVPMAKQEFANNGKDFLLSLESLWRFHGEPQAKPLEHWGSSELRELGVMLYQGFPCESDPDYHKAYAVGAEEELRILRGRIPQALLDRGKESDVGELENLANVVPTVRVWLAHQRRQQRFAVMRGAEGATLPQSEESPYVPLVELLTLLRKKDYRLLRSPDDLLAVLVEVLMNMEERVGQDIELLYYSSNKKRKHRKEDVLQAYLCCRLRDILHEKIQVPERETQVSYKQRNDIRVHARTLGGGSALVVIEVKWSSNAKLSTALEEQLVNEYLLREDLKHGIYLVGLGDRILWPSLKQRDAEGLTDALREQAKGVQSRYTEKLAIEPVVLDLRWISRVKRAKLLQQAEPET